MGVTCCQITPLINKRVDQSVNSEVALFVWEIVEISCILTYFKGIMVHALTFHFEGT